MTVQSQHQLHPDDGPAIYQVVDQGKRSKPLTAMELALWLEKPCHLLYDTTRGLLLMRRDLQKAAERIPLNGDVQRKTVSTMLDMLRVLAENPERRFTNTIYAKYANRAPFEPETFIRYINRLRHLIGDSAKHSMFIVTDDSVDSSVSVTGCAYHANSNLVWRVIRYIHGLSHPGVHRGAP